MSRRLFQTGSLLSGTVAAVTSAAASICCIGRWRSPYSVLALQLGAGAEGAYVALDGSAQPLKRAFNADVGKVRLLRYVSPTCGECLRAGRERERVVHERGVLPDDPRGSLGDLPRAARCHNRWSFALGRDIAGVDMAEREHCSNTKEDSEVESAAWIACA